MRAQDDGLTLFIGLGRMGAPMATLLAAKRPVALYDALPGTAAALADEIGARAIDSLETLPAGIDSVILMLPNSSIVEHVLEGETQLLARLPEGTLIVDMGSSEPASTARLAKEARGRGLGYVDAPVSGGVAKARTGELSSMAGGSPEDLDRAVALITPMTGSVVRVGASGTGHAAKALNNLLSATNIAAAAEVISVATKFGIDPAVMVEVLNASTGRSQSSEVKYPKHILTGRYDSAFALDLMVKDLGIARRLSDRLGVVAPVTTAADLMAQRALAELSGPPPLDHTELARLYETLNGVSFSAEGQR